MLEFRGDGWINVERRGVACEIDIGGLANIPVDVDHSMPWHILGTEVKEQVGLLKMIIVSWILRLIVKELFPLVSERTIARPDVFKRELIGFPIDVPKDFRTCSDVNEVGN